MYENLEIINKIEHKDKYIKSIKNFLFAKDNMNAPITVAEFFSACKDYPIVFTKDSVTKDWFASVMLGIKDKKNVFINVDGNWQEEHYVPAFFRRFPFVFANQPNKEELILAVDKDYLTSDDKDAKKLFNEEENSDFLNQVLNFLSSYQKDMKISTGFIQQLDELGLLEEKAASFTSKDGEKFNINGFYIVNEDKLKNLDKAKKELICEKDLSPLITAHLISLSNIQKLVNKKRF